MKNEKYVSFVYSRLPSIKEKHEFSIFICDFPRFGLLQFISKAGTNEESCLVKENGYGKHSNSHTVVW